MIMTLAHEYPVSLVCRLLDFPRSSYYHQPQAGDERALRAALLRVAEEWPTYGYRRLTAQLRREGLAVNSKRVRRLMRQLGLQGKQPTRKRRTTNSAHDFPRYPNLVQDMAVLYPDQVWVADITYVRLHQEFVYLAVLMDVFTRSIRGWYLGRDLDTTLTLTALQRALQAHRPEIHHSDQGLQYAATAYSNLLQQVGSTISMATVGEPTENGYAERLMRTIREEAIDLSEYQNYHDAYRQLGRFLDEVYTYKRIHSSLGYLTPAEFESQWLAQQAATVVVI
jgi:putative transposase